MVNITKRKLKILLVQTANSNLGDNVIADNHAYLIKKICDDNVAIFNYSLSSRDVEQVKFVDAVIFAGGILKTFNENFHIYIPELLNCAEKYNVPVFLSNIGVEKLDFANKHSISLKNALNLNCVKGIAVRDDIETLKNDYITNGKIKIYSTWDIAVWSKETYNIQSSNAISSDAKNKPVIGIGIVRSKLFSDYGHPEITYNKQLQFWKDVIKNLEEKQYGWTIFTNGDKYDEEMACNVLNFLGHGVKLPAPLDSECLIKYISSFNGVIAGRMHSNIIAYSLGIPSIGFVWNRKLRFWANKINYPERFLECENLNANVAVNNLLAAMESVCGPTKEFMNSSYYALKDFIDAYLLEKNNTNCSYDYNMENFLCANQLGSLRMRYPRTNSKEAFESSIKEGYKILLANIRATTDNKVVLVDRWCTDTYNILGVDSSKLNAPEKGITYEHFKKLNYYNRYKTLSFDEFIKLYSLCKNDYKLILSFGCPSPNMIGTYISCLKQYKERNCFNNKNIIFRLERKSDLEVFMKNFPESNFMYYFLPNKKIYKNKLILFYAYKKIVSWCSNNNIQYISVNNKIYDSKMISIAHSKGLKFALTSNDKIDSIINAIDSKADLILNQTYPVSYLNNLINN